MDDVAVRAAVVASDELISEDAAVVPSCKRRQNWQSTTQKLDHTLVVSLPCPATRVQQ